MKLDRLFISVLVILSVILPNCTEGWFYKSKKPFGYKGYEYLYPTVFLVPWMLTPKPSFLTLLLLKLLTIKSTVILGQSAGIGALLVGKGSALMMGTLAGFTMSQKMRTLKMLKDKVKPKLPSRGQGSKSGWGWAQSTNGNSQLDILTPPYYRWGINGKEPQSKLTKSRKQYQKLKPNNHDNPPSSSTQMEKLNITEIQKTEAFLEKQFGQLHTAEAEKRQLTLRLEEAQKLRLLMAKLKINPDAGIPEFIPLPEIQTKNQKQHRRNDLNEQRFVENLISETKGFFTLLSAFDRDSCVQKLVCEIHASTGPVAVDGQSLYYNNVISMFRIANTLLDENNTEASMKYRNAANFGAANMHSDACKLRFKSCGYSTRQLEQEASYLEN